MYWNYRVIKLLKKTGDISFDIREVYYEDDIPTSVTVNSCYPYSYLDRRDEHGTEKATKLEFLMDMRSYLASLKKPVLVFDEDLDKFTGDECSLEYEFDYGDLFGV